MRLHPARIDRYFELIRQFPLAAVKDERQYRRALAVVHKLAVRDEGSLDDGERTYLEALTQLVGDYEDGRWRREIGHASPLEALKYLMRENGLRPVDLGRILGSRSVASQILTGKRGLSKTHIRLLSDHFGVEPGLFFEKRIA